MRLYVLQLGEIEVDVPIVMPMEPERGARYVGPVLAFLIQLEDGRNVLVDTGLSPDHVENPEARIPRPVVDVRLRREDLLPAALARIGLAPGDVSVVVNTHFDFDHCGGNFLFPHAVFYVQRQHHEWASANRATLPATVDWDVPGIDYVLLDGDTPLFPGVDAVLTSGHVPGHQSLVVRLPRSGTVILAADAAQTHVMFEEERVVGTPEPDAVRASIRRLKAIRDAEGAQVLVCHDADAVRTVYRVPPAFYD